MAVAQRRAFPTRQIAASRLRGFLHGSQSITVVQYVTSRSPPDRPVSLPLAGEKNSRSHFTGLSHRYLV